MAGARLGILLALLPDWNVTLVWPPSGVALAAVLLGGRHALPGIFLGALIASLMQQPLPITQVTLYVGLTISLVPTVSALAAGEMLKRIWTKVPHAPRAMDLLKGYIAIGLASTMAASAGIGILYVSGLVSENEVGVTWSLWWLADFCGILIFGPIAWLAARLWKEYRHEFRPGPIIPAIMLNSVFAAAAILSFMILWNSEIDNVSKSLTQESAAAAKSVHQALRTAGADMEGIRSFLYASEHVSADEFRRYTAAEFSNRELHLNAQAVEWIPRVTDPGKWETQMHDEGLDRVRLYEIDNSGKRNPVARREEYFPVQYVQPITQANLNVIGFDLCSEKLRCTALERARNTGKLSMVAPVFLVQLDEPLNAMLLAVPVYRPDITLDTVAARRTSLTGFAIGVYLVAELIEGALLEANTDIDLHLFDVGMPTSSLWHHTRPSSYRAHSETAMPEPTLVNLQQGLNGSARLRFADHNWLVVATPGETYVQTHRTWTPWAVLALMLALGIALSSILIERITARKNIEDERQKTDQALLKAVAANESKSYFMAAASHDIKQPLYALAILTDTLLISKPGESAAPILKNLRSSIEEMSKHFDTLMDFTKFQDGSFEVNLVRFRLGDLSKRIDFEMGALCSRKGLTWNIDIEDVLVWSDPDLLLRLIRNLLTNAVNYTETGEIYCGTKTNADAVEFFISDTGVGIAAEEQEAVFERFVQLESRRIGAAGTGLGLSIVKKIDLALNLGLKMSSVVGSGTEFRFMVPRASPK